MAQIFPAWQTIQRLTPAPTAGELHLVDYLRQSLDDSFEVYFQPLINGDNPDVIVLREGHGVAIFEVKDWHLAAYHVKGAIWTLQSNNARVKSPIAQVVSYQKNFYELHIERLLERSIADPDLESLIRSVLYFHNETTQHAAQQIFGHRLAGPGTPLVLGYDSITPSGVASLVRNIGLNRPRPGFDTKLAERFRRYLQPVEHVLDQANEIAYTPRQLELAESEPRRRKIKGVAGSGKTVVLAKRAVNAHIRTRSPVLVLTFNITMRNYIHDRISRVKENFNWGNFHIIHYHQFFNAMANNLGLPIGRMSAYDDEDFFASVETRTPRYQAIFIDEAQDYRLEWFRILQRYFLADGGEFVLFGDEKQNIYGRILDQDRKVQTPIRGRWNELKESHRLPSRFAGIATDYQHHFFGKRYHIEKINSVPTQRSFFDPTYQYHFLASEAEDLMGWIMTKLKLAFDDLKVHPNDCCILASRISLLREIDNAIRRDWKWHTATTFEDMETFRILCERIEHAEELDRQIQAVRQSKKFNFWMNCGLAKLSTVHSFKGWEIETLVLVLYEDEDRVLGSDSEAGERTCDEELVYTAITRCRRNLIVLNLGNQKYHAFFSQIR